MIVVDNDRIRGVFYHDHGKRIVDARESEKGHRWQSDAPLWMRVGRDG
jgi:hypothetical protein